MALYLLCLYVLVQCCYLYVFKLHWGVQNLANDCTSSSRPIWLDKHFSHKSNGCEGEEDHWYHYAIKSEALIILYPTLDRH